LIPAPFSNKPGRLPTKQTVMWVEGVGRVSIWSSADCQSPEKNKITNIVEELLVYDVFSPALMAGALLASIPVALVYTIFLDRIISGLGMGGIEK